MSQHIVTTEIIDQLTSDSPGAGRITLILHEPLSCSEHLTHVDIIVDGMVGHDRGSIRLERVDADKLIHVLQLMQREANRPVTGARS